VGLLVLTLMSLLGYASYISRRNKWSVEETLLWSISSLIVLLYAFSLIKVLQFATYCLFGIGLFLLLLNIVMCRNDVKQLKKVFLSPGILTFILGSLFIWIKYRDYTYASWDEFSHWGFAIKQMFSLNGLVGPHDALRFKDYPPGTALFQYFVLKIIGYSEGNAYVAQNILLFSTITCLLQGHKSNRPVQYLLGTLLGVGAIESFGLGPEAIYADSVLACLFGATIVTYLNRSECKKVSDALKIAPLIAVIPLLKQIGILFAIIIVIFIILHQLFVFYRNNKSIHGLPFLTIMNFLIITFAPIVTYFSWIKHVRNLGAAISFKTNFGILDIYYTFFHSSAIDKQIIENFISAFWSRPVFKSLPVTSSMLVLLLITIALFFCLDKGKDREDFSFSSVTLFLGFLLYAFVHLLLYLFSFTKGEGLSVASFSRYMGIYFLCYCLPLIFFFQNAVSRVNFRALRTIAILCIVSLVGIFLVFSQFNYSMTTMVTNIRIQVHNLTSSRTLAPIRRELAPRITYVKEHTEPNSSIYMIWENTDGFEFFCSEYELAPRRTNLNFFNIAVSNNGSDDYWIASFSSQEWVNLLRNYDYVLIGNADDQFWQSYGSLFASSSNFRNHFLFRVEKNGSGGLVLTPM
jgi:hypothetical protein